ncbi:MAG: membrane protein insertion efficiency factor YidD [Actinomycetota bacterium]
MNAARRALWIAGVPARALLIGMIRLYRATLSGWLGGQCRFYPSCSHYAEDAVRTHGATKGAVLATWRVLRCNPFGKGGIDPVPAPRPRTTYEAITHTREGAHV